MTNPSGFAAGTRLTFHGPLSAERLLTGSPSSKARVGWMPSRLVTAAALSVAFPDSRKVAVVSTH